jgi:hypothetical protein
MLNPAFQSDGGDDESAETGGETMGDDGPDETGDGTNDGTSSTTGPDDSTSSTDDTSGAQECGNGVIEGDESCDESTVHNGSCVDCDIICHEGFEDCNGSADDGCEVDLLITAQSCGYCGHDCIGGDCVDGFCQPYLLAEGQDSPYDIVVDDKNAHWVNRLGNSVMQTAIDGNGPVQKIADNQNGPSGITIHNGDLYWTNFYGNEVMVGAFGNPAAPFAQAQSNPFGITNDGERACWGNFGNGTIACKTLDGNIAGTVASSQPQPWSITSLPGDLYWTTAATERSIQTLPEGDNTPVVLAAGLGTELGGLYTDGTWIYFAVPNPGYVAKIPINGGEEPTMVADNEPKPKDVVFDDEFVYWTNETAGEVAFKSRAGGNVMILGWSPGLPWAITHDDSAVYWTDLTDDTVWAVAKP